MALKQDLQKAFVEIRKEKERKFDQTVDLIINLQKYDSKRNPINLFVGVPHKIKDKKVAAFLESKNSNVDTITGEQFKKYTNKAALRRLIKKYDFFIAEAKLMPKVATTFGRVLGPAGKMPSPQLGIIMGNVNDEAINDLKSKIDSSVKHKVKESSVKLAIGKASMKDEELVENAMAVYNTLVKNLPRDKENVKNVEIKFTMSKPQRISIR